MYWFRRASALVREVDAEGGEMPWRHRRGRAGRHRVRLLGSVGRVRAHWWAGRRRARLGGHRRQLRGRRDTNRRATRPKTLCVVVGGMGSG